MKNVTIKYLTKITYDCGYCVNLDSILHTVFQCANATSIFENVIIKIIEQNRHYVGILFTYFEDA